MLVIFVASMALAAAVLRAQQVITVTGAPAIQNGQQAQAPQPPGTASVEGGVVAMGTNQPIAGAYVEIRRTECTNTVAAINGESANATTGADGRFILEKLHAGSWCLGAVRPGGTFAPVEYQQRGVKGRGVTIPVADGQKVTGIQMAMPQTGSISGRVVDSDGEPMGHVRVQVLEAFYQEGGRRLYTLNIVQTNDLGEFSQFWLPPGQYFLAAVPEEPTRQQVVFSVAPPGMGGHRSDAMPPVINRRSLETGEVIDEVYTPVYYGGGSEPLRAQAIDVQPGTSVNVELTFTSAKLRAYHVRGKIQNGAGQPASGAQVRLAPRAWSSLVIMPFAVADMDGNFDIPGVIPGDYVLYANGTAPNPNATIPDALRTRIAAGLATAPMMAVTGRFPLTIGSGDINGASFSLSPGFAFPGVFLIEGSDPISMPVAFRSIRVVLVRDPDIVGIQSQGTFTTAQNAGNANLQLTLQNLGNIQGLDPATLNALLQNANAAPPLPTANAPNTQNAPQPTTVDNAFRVQNAGPGDYRVYVSPLQSPFQWGIPSVSQAIQNYYVKSIRMGAADILSDGLHLGTTVPDGRMEVTIGIGGKVDGSVTTDRGGVAANVTVALVPDVAYRQRSDMYRSTTTDGSGKFQIQAIAPGDYEVIAWENVPDGVWQDPAFIRNYDGRGKRIRIEAQATAHSDLIVIPAGR